MKLEILEEAGEELHEAIAYYEELERGLGLRLKEEARQAIQWIQNNALLPRLRPKGRPAPGRTTPASFRLVCARDSTAAYE